MVVCADCEMNISTAGNCFFYMVGRCAASVVLLEGHRGPLVAAACRGWHEPDTPCRLGVAPKYCLGNLRCFAYCHLQHPLCICSSLSVMCCSTGEVSTSMSSA